MSFISNKSDEENYHELERQLRRLLRSSASDSTEVEQLKNRINRVRSRYGLSTYADLQPLKPLKNPFDPPKNHNSRFDKDPLQLKDPFSNTKPATPNDTDQRCPYCNSKLSNIFNGGKCPNCDATINETKDCGVPPHAPDPKNPYKRQNPTFIPQNKPINMAYNLNKSKKCRDDDATKDDETVSDVYTSEPFDQCSINMDERKKKKNVDDKKIEVMRSCLDLAIDG